MTPSGQGGGNLGEHRSNNFDALRLIAALAVLIGHAWPLTGVGYPPEIGGIKIYHLAVFVFFAVSGYLITTSWQRTPVVRRFLAARFLRIFPALILVVVLTVFVVGPLATRIPLGEYFGSSQTWGYLVTITLAASYQLPGVFVDNPLDVVNGSLWTLGPEFGCYLLVLALGLVLRARGARAIGWLIVAASLIGLALLPLGLPEPVRAIPTAMVFFAAGALWALALDRFELRMPLWSTPFVAAAWLVLAALLPALELPFAWIAVPYLALALGRASTPVLRRFGRFGDFSYGLYLWGYVTQQFVTSAFGVMPLWATLAIVVPAASVLAIASWHLVEKRAIAVKGRFDRAEVGILPAQ
ncbi:MAG: acyltransferase family protein [Microbacteriaceae bacterium]